MISMYRQIVPVHTSNELPLSGATCSVALDFVGAIYLVQLTLIRSERDSVRM